MTNKTEGGYRTTSVGSVGNYFEDQGLAPSIISFLFPLSISGLFYSFLNYYTRIKWKYIQSSRSHVRRVLWQFVFCFFFPDNGLEKLTGKAPQSSSSGMVSGQNVPSVRKGGLGGGGKRNSGGGPGHSGHSNRSSVSSSSILLLSALKIKKKKYKLKISVY